MKKILFLLLATTVIILACNSADDDDDSVSHPSTTDTPAPVKVQDTVVVKIVN